MKIINIDVIKQTYDVSPVEGDVNVIKVKFVNTPSEWVSDDYGVYSLFTKGKDSEIMNVDKATMECAVPNRMIAENSGLKVTLYAMNSDTANPRRYVVEPVWIAISEGYEVSATSGLNIDNMDAISTLIQVISTYPVEEQKRVEAENKRAEAEVRREEVVAEYGKDIEALVDGAPDRLNTLKKLASAINNDDHYSDTIMDEINALRSSANGALHNVNEHIEDYENPHHVTQGDVGLGHVDNTSDEDKPLSNAAIDALDLKVDKVPGMGLSSNDFTDLDKLEIKEAYYIMGDLSFLATQNADSLVEAINEVHGLASVHIKEGVSGTLNVNTEYYLGITHDLTLTFPSNASPGDVVYINFFSPEQPTVLTIDMTNIFDVEIIPEPDTGYEIFGKYTPDGWIVNYSEFSLDKWYYEEAVGI